MAESVETRLEESERMIIIVTVMILSQLKW
jgi:hypothetical protein